MQLIDDSRFNLIFSGRILTYFILFIVIFIVYNFFVYLIIDYYFDLQEEENLANNINLIESILDEKKKQLANYAKLLARFADLESINENTLLTRRVYNLHSSLNVRGIQIWDNELDLIFETGSGFVFGENVKLKDSILEVLRDGYSVSFYNQNEFLDLQITSFSPVFDEYSIRSSSYVSMTEVIKKEYINKIAYDIDGVMNFYNTKELKDENSERRKLSQIKGKTIYKEKIDNRVYFLSYLPIRDFYHNILGYYAIGLPKKNNIEILSKISILSLFFFSIVLIMLYRMYLLKISVFHNRLYSSRREDFA